MGVEVGSWEGWASVPTGAGILPVNHIWESRSAHLAPTIPGTPTSFPAWGWRGPRFLPMAAAKDKGALPQLRSLGSALGRACPGLALQLRPPP